MGAQEGAGGRESSRRRPESAPRRDEPAARGEESAHRRGESARDESAQGRDESVEEGEEEPLRRGAGREIEVKNLGQPVRDGWRITSHTAIL